MKERWGRNALIGLGVVVVSWLGLFVVSAVLTIYDDHQNLSATANRIKHDGIRQREALTVQVEKAKDEARQQIGELKTECAVKEGINQTLQKQNRDEQLLIAGCQTQAMKLLAPQPLTVTPMLLDRDDHNPDERIMRWLILTNRTITPTHVAAFCIQGVTQILSASISVLGSVPLHPGSSLAVVLMVDCQ